MHDARESMLEDSFRRGIWLIFLPWRVAARVFPQLPLISGAVTLDRNEGFMKLLHRFPPESVLLIGERTHLVCAEADRHHSYSAKMGNWKKLLTGF